MGTMFYTPGCRVLIESSDSVQADIPTNLNDIRPGADYQGAGNKIIDVTDDIVSGTVMLRENASHAFSFSLANFRRKYDGVFAPNDRIIIQMKRIRWLQVAAGYLTTVPYLSATGRTVSIRGECTLKRLRFHPYDSGLESVTTLLNNVMTENAGKSIDSGMAERARRVLVEIGGWPEDAIHLGGVPEVWTSQMAELHKKLTPALIESAALFGPVDPETGLPNPTGSDSTNNTTNTLPGSPNTAGGVWGWMFGNRTDIGADNAGSQADTPSTGGNTAKTDGIRFERSSDGLAPPVNAAWQFIQLNWPDAHLNSSVRPGDGGDHGRGWALDIGSNVGNPAVNKEANTLLNSILLWFLNNPHAFGPLKQVLWQNRIQTEGGGWKDYGMPISAIGAGRDDSHTQHLHLAFHGDSGQTAIGSMGSPWPGNDVKEFNPDNPTTVGPTGPGSGGGDVTGGVGTGRAFIDAHSWMVKPDPAAPLLTGLRGLMNDQPQLLPLVSSILRIGMRNYCSAPNGDFIAWFPDYFGLYNVLGVMQVEPIEVIDLGIDWSDENLKTHIFTVGSEIGYAPGLAEAEYATNELVTHGIASFELPELMKTLLGAQADTFWQAEKVFQRFGARPETVDFSETAIFSTREAEFWASCWHFMRNFASQFSTSISLTFMPELYPGMLLRIPSVGIQVYVNTVTHNINYSTGFTTTVEVSAPAWIGDVPQHHPRVGLIPAARSRDLSGYTQS